MQASETELFAKIFNVWKALTIFTKSSILDPWLGPNTPLEYYISFLDPEHLL